MRTLRIAFFAFLFFFFLLLITIVITYLDGFCVIVVERNSASSLEQKTFKWNVFVDIVLYERDNARGGE